jgi:hypothetical protein
MRSKCPQLSHSVNALACFGNSHIAYKFRYAMAEFPNFRYSPLLSSRGPREARFQFPEKRGCQ